MALFQRFQRNEQLFQVVREAPKTSEQDESFISLIVGLGNIGKEYQGTRHNVGFEVIDKLRQQNSFPDWQEKTKFKAYISEDFLNGKKAILAKPTTYMNLSGESVRALKAFYKVKNNEIYVIHDELDLPFGTVKEKQGGGSGGNNGLKSIISLVGEDFRRIRVGIKNSQLFDKEAPKNRKIDPADFVLAKFTSAEKKQLPSIIEAAIAKV